MKQKIGGYLFGLILLIMIFPNETLAGGHPILEPYQIEDRQIQGTAEAGETIYLYIEGKIYTVKANESGMFSLTLTEPIGTQNVSILLLDQWGYKESQTTYGPKNPVSGEVEPAPKVSYVGQTDDGSFYLTTSYWATIYAVYEGKMYTGKQELLIPKGTSTDIRVYAKREDGTKGATVVLSTTTQPKISVEAYDFQTKRFSGMAWPHAILTFMNDETGWNRTTLADADGQFTIDYAPSVEMLKTEHSLKIVSEGKVSIQSEVTVPAFTLNPKTAYYALVQTETNEIEGLTYPNTPILLDGKTCTTSDAKGIFRCTVQELTEPIHELSFQTKEVGTVSTLVELPAKLENFPFVLDRPLSSEHPILSGKTLPNRRFLVGYDGLSFPLTSDAEGHFTMTLPKQYKGSIYLSLISLNGAAYSFKEWTIQDERPLLKPNMRFSGKSLELTNQMKDLPNVKGEILLEHADGSFDVQGFTFPKRMSYEQKRPVYIEDIQPGDRYTMTLMTEENHVRKATFEGTLSPLMEITLNPFGSYDQTLTGRGEPGTTVKVELATVYVSHTENGRSATYEGTVSKDGTFALALRYPNNTKSWAIDDSGWAHISVARPGTMDVLSYYIMFTDKTAPTITFPKITDSARESAFYSDDKLKSAEIRYYKGETLVKTVKLDFSQFGSYRNAWDKEGNRTLKQDGITQIEVRGTNRSNQTSDWVRKSILSTTYPLLTVSEILYGDKVIQAKTVPNTKIKASIGKQQYEAIADASGRAVFQLKRPVTLEDYTVQFVVRNEAGSSKSIEKRPIGYPVQDIHWSEKKNKVWFVTHDTHIRPSRYTFKVDGKEVKLAGTRPRSVFDVSKVKTPFQVELTLRNTDGTIRSTFKKTIRSSYENKKVAQLTASSKTGLIKGMSQPYHMIEVYDDNDLNLAGIVLYQDKQFQTKAYRPLRVGKTITIYSKDPFGQKSTVYLKIKDDIVPKTPTISRVTSKSTSVTGKTEAKANVVITYMKKTYRTQGNAKGAYRLRITAWKTGEVISVYAEDTSKNRSAKVMTKVVK